MPSEDEETKSVEESESLLDAAALKETEERRAAALAAKKLAEAHGEFLPPSENDFDAKSMGGKRDKMKWARFLLFEFVGTFLRWRSQKESSGQGLNSQPKKTATVVLASF